MKRFISKEPLKSRLVLIAVIGVLGAAGIWFAQGVRGRISADALPRLARAADFSMTDQNGEPFDARSLAGRVWIADFMFTRCPGACPLMTREMKALHDRLPGVRFVSFTSDPSHDTPQKLAEFAGSRGAQSGRWSFVSGPVEEVSRVSESFLLGKITDPASHSLRFVLVDSEGNMRGAYDSQDPASMKRLARDAELLTGTKA